ncbi:acyltransferase [Terrimonas sp. NA20]|uniref:Acyltransferase n=1 Tax=Terrimonas ginsenosidimutans TaxID=2908004 RepID=A0ABS9KTZ9_9BACT|nr:acyltransferase [Terrimonas ginsenosidimutans]MCG2615817.1 acyltransferase [Terrimonas ginsenosidimutans]
MTRTNYFPQLDSVRGLSFLAIFFFHAVHPERGESVLAKLFLYYYDQLPLAIDVFFILSSFLLTWLGVKEFQKQQRVSLGKFFQRRILRIWPLYFLLLTISFLLLAPVAARAGHPMSMPDPFYYYFFIANFYKAEQVFFLQILWTISVEEQFYIFLGLVMRFFFRYLRVIFVVLTIVSLGFSIYCHRSGISHYFHTLTYCVDFAMGGLAALLYTGRSSLITWTERLRGGRLKVFYLWPLIQLTVFFFIQLKVETDLLNLLNRFLFITYLCLLLIEQLGNENRTGILQRNRFLILTGRISFGLYCFHGISITAFEQFIVHSGTVISPLLVVPVIFAFNFSVAYLSFRYLETPFLRLKDRLRVI